MNQLCFPAAQSIASWGGLFRQSIQALEGDYIKSNDKLNKEYDLNNVSSSITSKK